MRKIVLTIAAGVLACATVSASAWWGGPGFGSWADDFAGNGSADFSMSMSMGGSGRGWGRGWNRNYDYYGPYGYQNYGYGAPLQADAPKPVAPKAPAAASQ